MDDWRAARMTESDHTDPSRSTAVKSLEIVLVVEDDPLIRMVIVDLLEELGTKAEEAGSTADALAVMQRTGERIDAAIIDLGLPDGSGHDLALSLRQGRPGLPIIIATGYCQAAVPPSPTKAFAYLQKPYDLAMLKAALAEVMGA
jgi:CheY-like chemotaxis protein